MAWPPPIPTATRTNATDQGTLHPTDHNQMAQALTDIVSRISLREVGYAESLSPQTGIGSSVVYLSGIACTFLAIPGRKYKLSFGATFIQRTAIGTMDIWFSVNAAGLQKMSQTNGINGYCHIDMSRRISTLSGSTTITVGVATNAGSVDLSAGAQVPAYLLIEDIGGSV